MVYTLLSGPMVYPKDQGRTNPVFSRPCLFLSDTRRFRRFRRFLRSKTLVFNG